MKWIDYKASLNPLEIFVLLRWVINFVNLSQVTNKKLNDKIVLKSLVGGCFNKLILDKVIVLISPGNRRQLINYFYFAFD